MLNKFIKDHIKICVAVQFDDTGRHALKIAEQYCHRTGASLHVVHICENLFTNGLVSLGMMAPISMEMLQAAQENLQDAARTKMVEIVNLVKHPIEISTKIFGGSLAAPADMIEAEALATDCAMIIVGARSDSHRFIPRGFSCALSLMSRSKLPVMVVNTKQTVDLNAERLHLLIADDLKEHSIAAVKGGFHLACAMKNTDIKHVHINAVTMEAIQASCDTAFATSHAQSPLISAKDIYVSLIDQLEKKLEVRTTGMNKSLGTSSGHYNSSVVTDHSVTSCLEKFVEQKHIHLLVFGRHQTLYHKPFVVGQMPYYAMLNLSCPIIVFPSAVV